MPHKIITLLLCIITFLSVVPASFAQNNRTNIYFFWGDGCPHCAKEKPLLEELSKQYSNIRVYDFEVWKSEQNRKLLVEVGSTLKVDVPGVPFTVIGDVTFSGFSELITSEQIKERVHYCSSNSCPDSIADIVGTSEKNASPEAVLIKPPQEEKQTTIPEKVVIPILGAVFIKNLSLPVLTIVLGALDGFNPCAMWTLMFLISLLLGMQDKKRRWLLGSAFIIASAFVYFLFMTAWLNLLMFLGFIVWVRIIIGLIAIGGGAYNLREYVVNKDNTCKVTGGAERQKVFTRLKDITHERQLFIALGGIVLLAFAVNLVELVCSAGLPVIFTQILTLSQLAPWQYYGYMLLYILIFMLDDLLVFFTAMITLELSGLSTKYSRISHLIGGALMVGIGLLLIFKPELLMFG